MILAILLSLGVASLAFAAAAIVRYRPRPIRRRSSRP